MVEIEGEIQDLDLLTNVFGRFPSFHDAEVMQITIDRGEWGNCGPSLEAIIHLFEMTSDVDENNRFILKNHVLVCFRFSEIKGLRIEDFNHQNVLDDLNIVSQPNQENARIGFKVIFEGVYGLDAAFNCTTISVKSVQPFVPKRFV